MLLCLSAGVLFAVLLYYRDSTFVDQPKRVRWFLSFLRFLSVSALSMLLLSPFLRLLHETTQEPVVVIGQDDSSSIRDGMSAQDSAAYQESFDKMVSSLRSKYDVRVLSFGEHVAPTDTFTYGEKETDIAQFLTYATDQYGDQNLGAIVLASDGLYNHGSNPLYVPKKTTAPMYAIALGDTVVKPDLSITHVFQNNIAFLGDKFPVQIDIAASKLSNRTATLKIERIDGNQRISVEQRTLHLDSDDYFDTEEVLLEAIQPGILHYRASVSGIAGEALYSNNVKDFYVEVIDGRVRVLILENSPHPDIAAIYTVLQEQKNYTAEEYLAKDFTGDLKDYDLVILHQLPSAQFDAAPLLARLDALKLPRLFIVGGQTQLGRFNASQPYLDIQAGHQSLNEVTGQVDGNFTLFTVPDELMQQIPKFPPLLAPFGQYTSSPSAQVYLWQQIGKVETQFPLLLFGEEGNTKTGILAAEGFWRWRLYDFMQHRNHDMTNTLLSKTIQYLTVKEDKRRFRAAPTANLFHDNQVVGFDAELYNRSYERITDPDVFLEVRDDQGNTYSYTFSKNSSAYFLSLGKFPVGEYTYTAYTDYEGQRQQVKGKFSVQQTQLESYITTADHQLLHALTAEYGGTVYYPNALDDLSTRLLSDEKIKPVMYQSVINQPLIHLRWIFFIFLLTLGLEWFIRRYLGGY